MLSGFASDIKKSLHYALRSFFGGHFSKSPWGKMKKDIFGMSVREKLLDFFVLIFVIFLGLHMEVICVLYGVIWWYRRGKRRMAGFSYVHR